MHRLHSAEASVTGGDRLLLVGHGAVPLRRGFAAGPNRFADAIPRGVGFSGSGNGPTELAQSAPQSSGSHRCLYPGDGQPEAEPTADIKA